MWVPEEEKENIKGQILQEITERSLLGLSKEGNRVDVTLSYYKSKSHIKT
jgi:hypothetical protein